MKESLSLFLSPKSINEIIGQKHLINDKNGIVTKMISSNFLTHLIFYGPPGTGKSTMAKAICNDLKLNFELFNASNDKKDKLVKIIDNSKDKQIVLIIDEIHRMNKNIQDYLLEYMESRKIIIFITTTENPYFTINPAIRSRGTILSFKPITSEEIHQGLVKLIKDNDLIINISDKSLLLLSQLSNGDLRIAVNRLEILINMYKNTKIDDQIISNIFDNANIKGFADGDEFHDLKSALQKSIRGSDVDAALHYWARLMVIGDFETIMRRMTIIAYEDIGLANPAIPMRVTMACENFRKIGLPEGRIILGLAIIEMSLSEKSNSSLMAIDQALNDVHKGISPEIPLHLRDAHYKSASDFGYGIDYKYPHNFSNSHVKQQYLPEEIKNIKYFNFKNSSSYEKKLREIYEKFTNKNNIK